MRAGRRRGARGRVLRAGALLLKRWWAGANHRSDQRESAWKSPGPRLLDGVEVHWSIPTQTRVHQLGREGSVSVIAEESRRAARMARVDLAPRMRRLRGCRPKTPSTRRARRTASTTAGGDALAAVWGAGALHTKPPRRTPYLTRSTRAGARRSGAAKRRHEGRVFSPPASAIRAVGGSSPSPRRKHPARGPRDRSTAGRRRRAGRARTRTRRRGLHANTGRDALVAVCRTKSSGYRTSAANVPLTAPSTAGAGADSNAASVNPASRSWRSVQPQKPNISAQSAQNMSAQCLSVAPLSPRLLRDSRPAKHQKQSPEAERDLVARRYEVSQGPREAVVDAVDYVVGPPRGSARRSRPGLALRAEALVGRLDVLELLFVPPRPGAMI